MEDIKYIEYLRKKIEALQEENTQLKIKIDRLERDPLRYAPTTPIPTSPTIPTNPWYRDQITITCDSSDNFYIETPTKIQPV